ncbi:hypothetical protein V493_02443 [Pseudogymnoascus sp. VKM F-4281 (FW-2241)]|nr:hypothetical protein V493_02443 [Pseudogymnoascus sp. VKM F-4281 (FW-2241)]
MGSMAFDIYNFKWEASPGLDPRSVSSCIGVHCEPCRRYHQQLHFIQKAHECKSCIRADEMHHRRHRSIAKLVKELEAHDREGATRATRTKTKSARVTQFGTPGAKPFGHNEYLRHGGMSETGSENVENLEPTRSVNDEESGDKDAYENQIFDETEPEPFITMPNTPTHISAPLTPRLGSSISSFGYESSPATSSKKKDFKRARRTARLTNNNAQSIVSNGFLEFIAEALHGNKIMDISSAMFEEEGEEIGGNQFKNEDLMRENLGFQTFTRNSVQTRQLKDRWRKLGPGGKAREIAEPCPTAPGSQKPKFVNINETTRFDVNFFARLGVKYENKNDTSKVRSEIVLKLANKILDDMTVIGREEYETQVREAGFWRFVNRAAAQNLQEAHQDFSWATGEFRKRRKPGMSSEGNGETELGDSATGGPDLGAGGTPGQDIQDTANDSSDDGSVPGTPSLVGSAFETQAEEEKETPQMRTPFVLKFTNFDSGRKEVLWTATPSKVLSSSKNLSSVEPETLPSLPVSSPQEVLSPTKPPEVSSPPAVLLLPKTTSSPKAPPAPKVPSTPKVSSTPKAPFSPKFSSVPNAISSPKVLSTPKAPFSPAVWSSLKQNQLKPTKLVVNEDKQKRLGPMNSFRLVKIEKKQVAVQLKHESSYEICRDPLKHAKTGTAGPAPELALSEADEENLQDDDDIWEVVRPSLPNVRAKNPYDLLSTVDEGSGKEYSSSEEGSGPN